MTFSPLNVSCSESHFMCPDGLCLPIVMRCNGIYECVGKSDEEDCDDYQCPGYYRSVIKLSWVGFRREPKVLTKRRIEAFCLMKNICCSMLLE